MKNEGLESYFFKENDVRSTDLKEMGGIVLNFVRYCKRKPFVEV